MCYRISITVENVLSGSSIWIPRHQRTKGPQWRGQHLESQQPGAGRWLKSCKSGPHQPQFPACLQMVILRQYKRINCMSRLCRILIFFLLMIMWRHLKFGVISWYSSGDDLKGYVGVAGFRLVLSCRGYSADSSLVRSPHLCIIMRRILVHCCLWNSLEGDILQVSCSRPRPYG